MNILVYGGLVSKCVVRVGACTIDSRAVLLRSGLRVGVGVMLGNNVLCVH